MCTCQNKPLSVESMKRELLRNWPTCACVSEQDERIPDIREKLAQMRGEGASEEREEGQQEGEKEAEGT